jgi:hypothetical protein
MSAIPLTKGLCWWGSSLLKLNQSRRLAIGGLVLVVTRMKHEWQVAYQSSDIEVTDWTLDYPSNFIPIDETINRFVLKGNTERMKLSPMAGDRPFVIQPQNAFSLPVGHSVLFYVSTVIWIRVTAGEQEIVLLDVPARLPSDTWFGPNTMAGEMCYASQTAGRLDIDLLPKRPFRVVTPVQLDNNGKDTLLIERLKLPVPYLSIYASDQNMLWTERVCINRTKDLNLAELSVNAGCPDEATDGSLVAAPRQAGHTNSFVQAISHLLG